MARNTTRRQIVSRAIQARQPRSSGGTTAPRSAGRGPAVSGNRPSRHPQWRPGGPISGPINPGKTQYTAGTRPGAGGGSGAPAPANVAPTPWNSLAEQIVSGARKNYLNSQGNFDLAEQEAKQDFGLDQGFNDYQSNPYSRAALLEQSFQNANRGTMNSRGLQLYSGSTSNALGANRGTYDLNRDELARTYRDALGEIGKGRTEAAERKAEEEREAEWKRIEAAEAQEPDAEAAPGGGGGGGGGGNRSKSKPKSKGGGGGGGGNRANPPGTGWKNPPGGGRRR